MSITAIRTLGFDDGGAKGLYSRRRSISKKHGPCLKKWIFSGIWSNWIESVDYLKLWLRGPNAVGRIIKLDLSLVEDV
jgi:hypothetical protein